jgi:hypothetical protein
MVRALYNLNPALPRARKRLVSTLEHVYQVLVTKVGVP